MSKKRGIESIWLKDKKNRHVQQSSVVWNATLWITTPYNLVHDSPCFGGGERIFCLQLFHPAGLGTTFPI